MLYGIVNAKKEAANCLNYYLSLNSIAMLQMVTKIRQMIESEIKTNSLIILNFTYAVFFSFIFKFLQSLNW